MNYKKEDLKLYNMKKEQVVHTLSKFEVFAIEKEMLLEEKIEFIDKQKDGIATYLLELIEKWNDEKDGLPQHLGRPKTVSEKAWIRRNDTRDLMNSYDLGTYSLFGNRYSLSTKCPKRRTSYELAYTGQHVANQWFHDLLTALYREEVKYFRENDPYTIKLNKVKSAVEKYHIYFNSMELNDIVWNGLEDVLEENLDAYIKAFEEVEKKISVVEKNIAGKIKFEYIEE